MWWSVALTLTEHPQIYCCIQEMSHGKQFLESKPKVFYTKNDRIDSDPKNECHKTISCLQCKFDANNLSIQKKRTVAYSVLTVFLLKAWPRT